MSKYQKEKRSMRIWSYVYFKLFLVNIVRRYLKWHHLQTQNDIVEQWDSGSSNSGVYVCYVVSVYDGEFVSLSLYIYFMPKVAFIWVSQWHEAWLIFIKKQIHQGHYGYAFVLVCFLAISKLLYSLLLRLKILRKLAYNEFCLYFIFIIFFFYGIRAFLPTLHSLML